MDKQQLKALLKDNLRVCVERYGDYDGVLVEVSLWFDDEMISNETVRLN